MSVSIIPAITDPVAASPIADGRLFSAELIVPLVLIRDHAKIDDVLTVSDAQLSLYRKTGIEQAERYTGLLIGKSQRVTETLNPPKNLGYDSRKGYRHTLQYPVATDLVYVYGPGIQGHQGTIRVTPGSTKIKLPNIFSSLDFSPCCGPNGGADSGLFNLMYLAGYTSESEVPGGVIAGILQFITWLVNHPGDEFLSVRNTLTARSGALEGTNNPAVASGALELWRTYMDSIS